MATVRCQRRGAAIEVVRRGEQAQSPARRRRRQIRERACRDAVALGLVVVVPADQSAAVHALQRVIDRQRRVRTPVERREEVASVLRLAPAHEDVDPEPEQCVELIRTLPPGHDRKEPLAVDDEAALFRSSPRYGLESTPSSRTRARRRSRPGSPYEREMHRSSTAPARSAWRRSGRPAVVSRDTRHRREQTAPARPRRGSPPRPARSPRPSPAPTQTHGCRPRPRRSSLPRARPRGARLR